jgi:hypothetical protein
MAHNPFHGLYQNGISHGRYNLNPGPRNKNPVTVRTTAEKSITVNNANITSRVLAFLRRRTRAGIATNDAMTAAGSKPCATHWGTVSRNNSLRLKALSKIINVGIRTRA